MQPSTSLAIVALLATAPAQAAEAVPSLSGSIGQLVIGFGIVIALLLASLWLIKRLSAPRGLASGMKVLGAVPVGSRERVVLVEIADKVLVLGVTPASMNTLHTLEANELRRMAPAPATGAQGADFSKWFRQAMERNKHAD